MNISEHIERLRETLYDTYLGALPGLRNFKRKLPPLPYPLLHLPRTP